MTKKRLNAYVLLLIVSLIWGAAAAVVKNTLTWFDPLVFLTYRFAISAVIAGFVFAASPVALPRTGKSRWITFITMFLSTPLAIGLFFLALNKTSALSGSLLTAGEPLFIILGGVLLFRERITKMESIGITVTLIGTAIAALGPLVLNHTVNHVGTVEGNLLLICSVIADMFAALLTKLAIRHNVSSSLLAHGQFILSFLLFLPILFCTVPVATIVTEFARAPLQAHLGVLFMAVLSGSVAYALRNIAIQSIEISEVAVFYYLQPVWGSLLAVLWLGDRLTPAYTIGGIIITIGVVLSEYRRRKTKKLRFARQPARVQKRRR